MPIATSCLWTFRRDLEMLSRRFTDFLVVLEMVSMLGRSSLDLPPARGRRCSDLSCLGGALLSGSEQVNEQTASHVVGGVERSTCG